MALYNVQGVSARHRAGQKAREGDAGLTWGGASLLGNWRMRPLRREPEKERREPMRATIMNVFSDRSLSV